MTDIEQREPVAWRTYQGGYIHTSRPELAEQWGDGAEPLYTGQQLAEVEARAQRHEQTIVDAWNAFGPTIAHSIHDVEDLDIVSGGTLAEQIAELTTQRDTAEAEAERLRALVDELSASTGILIATISRFMRWIRTVLARDETAELERVIEHASVTFRAARSLRDRLGVEG